MKLKVGIGALLWVLLITGLHVQLNVGWHDLWQRTREVLGLKRPEMLVGFLPVT